MLRWAGVGVRRTDDIPRLHNPALAREASEGHEKPPSPASRERGGPVAKRWGGEGAAARSLGASGGAAFPHPPPRSAAGPPSPASGRGWFFVALAEARGLVWRPGLV